MTMKYPVFALILSCLYIAPLYAEGSNLKIGFVNPIKILESAKQVQEANKRLEQEFAPREGKLSNSIRDVQQMKDRLAKDEAIMSRKDAADLKRDILSKERDAKRAQDEFQEDYNIRRSEELDKLQKKISKSIEELAKQEDYDFILSEGVVYASDRVDITDTVLKYLNNN